MKLKVSFVDAFTGTAFKGNPAAVIVTDEWLKGISKNLNGMGVWGKGHDQL